MQRKLDLSSSGGLSKEVLKILNDILEKKIDKKLQYLYEAHLDNHIHIITILDPNYPQALLNLIEPPFCLFLKGKPVSNGDFLFPLEHACISIVGSRNANLDACNFTEKIASTLSHHQVTVVSGLARGIDYHAHLGAIQSNLEHISTIAVLASSVNQCYPQSSLELYKKIYDGGGIFVSEYALNTKPLRQYFIARNRIIAALSRCTLVTQAKQNSGALITAKYALDLGKEVAVLPWSIMVEQAKGSNKLLQQGAIPILSINDLVHDYKEECKTIDLSNPILKFLSENGACSLEKIQNNLNLSYSELVELEIQDLIKIDSNQRVSLF